METTHLNQNPRTDRAGLVTQVSALISAVLASTCCWLPLLLLAFGVSGGAMAGTFEAWRPVLLPVTFALLGVAFYFTYRKPKTAIAGTGADCCAMPAANAGEESCCPTGNAKGLTLKKVNKAMLWVVTAFVLAFAFFPNYVGYLFGSGDTLAARDDLDKVAVAIEGMTCEACAVNIEDSLRKVPGVVATEVNYQRHEALIGVAKDAQPPREAILAAIDGAGNYRGRFTDQAQWTLTLNGMTCQACAEGIQAALAGLPGVSGVSVSYEQGQATVTAALSLDEKALRKTVSDAGYKVTSADQKRKEQ